MGYKNNENRKNEKLHSTIYNLYLRIVWVAAYNIGWYSHSIIARDSVSYEMANFYNRMDPYLYIPNNV